MQPLDIKGPEDIKSMTEGELEITAQNIRSFLVESIAKTGGHLGSNLGIVELTMALHKSFDSPSDKLIFDVGHQGYVHKILTGRAKDFPMLRQYEGLSGFLKRSESVHDVWEAGHSSTSISAACGFAYARDIKSGDNHVVAVIGDGSLTNGMALEALNHIVELKQKVIIVINDNEMSISSNVGFIDNILKGLEKSATYDNTKASVHKTLDVTPGGKHVSKAITTFKSKLKTEINGAKSFFNLMGFKYYGPVNGHNFKDLDTTFESAKKYDGPVIIHVKTEKGKGYEPAAINQWHGIGPFNPETGTVLKPKTGLSYSGLVARTVRKFMHKNDDIAVITPAMIDGSELSVIKEQFPNRITDVGIAEEHAITFAGALALDGIRPFVSIYSTFLQRGYDQVFHDLVRQNTNVVIGIDRAGLVGDDGETHQGIYDISFLTHMPNIEIMMGKNESELRSLLKYGFNSKGVSAIRYPRGGAISQDVNVEDITEIKDTSWVLEKEGAEGFIVTYGPDVEKYQNLLRGTTEIGVINARFIKPIDENMLDRIANKKIIIAEEHQRLGGLNSLIIDYYASKNIKANIKVCAINDKFVEQGNVDILRKVNNIDCESVLEIAKEFIDG